MQSRRGKRERKKEKTGRSPVLPEATLLHSSTVPLCSIVADMSANDMHLWKRHERARCAGATDSWKMAASVVVWEGVVRPFHVLSTGCRGLLACLPVHQLLDSGREQHLAPWQPTKQCPRSHGGGETTRAEGEGGLHAKALVWSMVYEMGGVMSGG